jgi:hypothetical protein
MECWNTGFGGRRSIFYKVALIRSKNQAIIRFSYPIFHFSTIPLFHWLSTGQHHPSGVNIQPGPLPELLIS